MPRSNDAPNAHYNKDVKKWKRYFRIKITNEMSCSLELPKSDTQVPRVFYRIGDTWPEKRAGYIPNSSLEVSSKQLSSKYKEGSKCQT